MKNMKNRSKADWTIFLWTHLTKKPAFLQESRRNNTSTQYLNWIRKTKKSGNWYNWNGWMGDRQSTEKL